MSVQTPLTVTGAKELRQQVELLAALRSDSGPVISCYLDTGDDIRELSGFVRRRLAAADGSAGPANAALERVRGQIDAIVSSDMPPNTRGVAMFLVADGRSQPVSVLPFAVPLRNSLSISTSPDLFPLLRLKERYGRFTFVLARPQGLHIAEVDLGKLSTRAWIASKAGAGIPENGYADTEAARADLQAQFRVAERVLRRHRSGPLFLAGDAETMKAIGNHMSAAMATRLLGAIPVDSDLPLHKVAARCLRSLMDFGTHQALEWIERTLTEVDRHGRAVAGLDASLRALRDGSAEHLLLSQDFRPEPGWSCDRLSDVSGAQVPQGAAGHVAVLSPEPVDRRVELVRLAGQRHVPIEFTDEPALLDHQGIACLLRDHPEQAAQGFPPRYGSLDLVA